jgi:hypothetical protein
LVRIRSSVDVRLVAFAHRVRTGTTNAKWIAGVLSRSGDVRDVAHLTDRGGVGV